jgi:hypothetical protein
MNSASVSQALFIKLHVLDVLDVRIKHFTGCPSVPINCHSSVVCLVSDVLDAFFEMYHTILMLHDKVFCN